MHSEESGDDWSRGMLLWNFCYFYMLRDPFWCILAPQTVHISTFDILNAQQYWMTGITGNNRVAFVAT